MAVLPWFSDSYLYPAERPRLLCEIDPKALQAVANDMHAQQYGEPRYSRRHSSGVKSRIFVQDFNSENIGRTSSIGVGEALRNILRDPLQSLIELHDLKPGWGYASMTVVCVYPGGYELPDDKPKWNMSVNVTGGGFMTATGEQPKFALPLRPEYIDGNLEERLNRDDPKAPVEFYTPNEGEVYQVDRHLMIDPDPTAVMQRPRLSVFVSACEIS